MTTTRGKDIKPFDHLCEYIIGINAIQCWRIVAVREENNRHYGKLMYYNSNN